MTLKGLFRHVLVDEGCNEGFELSLAEMRRGMLLTKCPNCKDTTKHQTVSPNGKPFRPCLNSFTKGRFSSRYSRKCLECNTIHEF